MDDSNKSLSSYELELYKQVLDKERERRETGSSRVFATITIVVAFAGASVWLLTEFVEKFYVMNFRYLVLCLIMFCIILLAVITFKLFGILCVYIGLEQDPEAIRNMVEAYKKKYSQSDKVIEEIETVMANSYIESAIHDFKQNNIKSEKLSDLYHFIMFEIISLSITFIVQCFCLI